MVSGLTGSRPGKQPALRQHHAAAASLPPPGAQQREQLGREHRIAISAALALLDPQHHARAVDVADLERDHLGDAQPGAIGRGERRLVLRPRRRLEQKRDLLRAQHERQLARLAHDRETAGEIRPVERHTEEEAQGRDRAVDARRADTGLGLVQLEAAHLLGRRRVGRAADEGRERPDMPDVVVCASSRRSRARSCPRSCARAAR